MKISIVIPVYNNQGSIKITYEKINSLFEKELPEHIFELVFVDDGSKDDSLSEIMQLRNIDPSKVKVIVFTANFGQLPAVIAGFREASGDAIISMSADLQDPPELIPQMVEKWLSGDEIVICHRTNREDSFLTMITSKIWHNLFRLSHPQHPPGGFDTFLMDRKVVNVLNPLDMRHSYYAVYLLKTGYKTSFIPYNRKKRTIGKSQYNFWRRLKVFLDAILSASYLPVRFISFIGLITALSGFFYSILIVISWLRGATPFAGWAPLMIAILTVGGIIMLMLGIIGEYLWRISEDIRQRPLYVVRDKYL